MVQAMEKASGKKVGPTRAVGPQHTPAHTPPPATLNFSARCCSRHSSRWQFLRPRTCSPKHPLPSLQIPYKVVARREGDVAACYANPSLAHEELGWTAALGLDRMCECLPLLEG